MSASSLIAARSLAAQFPWSRYRTFIDIGTAQGCVPVEIARAHPHLRGGGFDLPEIGPAFTSYVASQQLSDRLTFYPGDFFTDPLPQADVLIMGRILHNWGVSSRVALVEKAYQALTPGGALIVYDPLIDDTRREPAGLLSSLKRDRKRFRIRGGGLQGMDGECRLLGAARYAIARRACSSHWKKVEC